MHQAQLVQFYIYYNGLGKILSGVELTENIVPWIVLRCHWIFSFCTDNYLTLDKVDHLVYPISFLHAICRSCCFSINYTELREHCFAQSLVCYNQQRMCFFIYLELWERAIPISGQTMANIGPKCKSKYILYCMKSEFARLETNCTQQQAAKSCRLR